MMQTIIYKYDADGQLAITNVACFVFWQLFTLFLVLVRTEEVDFRHSWQNNEKCHPNLKQQTSKSYAETYPLLNQSFLLQSLTASQACFPLRCFCNTPLASTADRVRKEWADCNPWTILPSGFLWSRVLLFVKLHRVWERWNFILELSLSRHCADLDALEFPLLASFLPILAETLRIGHLHSRVIEPSESGLGLHQEL